MSECISIWKSYDSYRGGLKLCRFRVYNSLIRHINCIRSYLSETATKSANFAQTTSIVLDSSEVNDSSAIELVAVVPGTWPLLMLNTTVILHSVVGPSHKPQVTCHPQTPPHNGTLPPNHGRGWILPL